MSWQITMFRWMVAVLLLAGSGYAVARHMRGEGGYGAPEVLQPAGSPKALVVVFPDPLAPQRGRAVARQLAERGALVAVVDTRGYLRRLGTPASGACGVLADDAERFGKHLLRRARVDTFLPPLLVGDGEGAQLVRQAMAAAAPEVVSGAVVAGGAAVPARLAWGPPAPTPAQGRLLALPADVATDAVTQAVVARFQDAAGVAGLPLVELPVAGSHRLAILISGDGGWRELDKGIAAELNRRGVSVVGWNSLRYFWTARTPQQIGDALARVMAGYGQRWHADDIALVGYSFGADVMPFAYHALPVAQRRQVRFISLLGLAHRADFEVRVGGWLGLDEAKAVPILPQLAGIDPARLQCIHGAQEKDTLCPELQGRGIDVVARPGGHHFDHDPVPLATQILHGWQRAAPVATDAHA
jgi:type IV secretory pathway VirJ component